MLHGILDHLRVIHAALEEARLVANATVHVQLVESIERAQMAQMLAEVRALYVLLHFDLEQMEHEETNVVLRRLNDLKSGHAVREVLLGDVLERHLLLDDTTNLDKNLVLHDLLERVEVKQVSSLGDLAPLLLHGSNLLQVHEDIIHLLQLALVC